MKYVILALFITLTISGSTLNIINNNSQAPTSDITKPIQILNDKNDSNIVYQAINSTLFANIDQNDYYSYKVLIKNQKQVIVQLLDGYLNVIKLTFKKQNNLYFSAAYKNFIIVQQKLNQNETISYWVLKIARQDFSYQLQNFPISSTVDNEGFEFQNDYSIALIMEYDQQNKFLYISSNSTNDTNVYGIDVGNKGGQGKLITIGWFYYENKVKEHHQYVIGGNAKVVVDATNDQFLIDQNNTRVNDSDPTIYKIINASKITNLTIYPKGSAVYNLVDWYFQYVSWSSDYKNITTFVYQGYNESKPFGENVLISNAPIKIYHDSYNYFIAVSDSDAYITYVYWNEGDDKYVTFSGLLSNEYTNKDQLKTIIKNLSSALSIILKDQHLYVISQKYFWVYSLAGNPKPVIYQKHQKQLKKNVSLTDVAIQRLFQEIKIYHNRRG